MTKPTPGSGAWLAQVTEPIVDPDQPIIDAHHHLWRRRFGRDYLLPELWADTESGHHVTQTVFVECGAFYWREGPTQLRPCGETAAIAGFAREARRQPARTQIGAIVAHADLRLGADAARLQEVLDCHWCPLT